MTHHGAPCTIMSAEDVLKSFYPIEFLEYLQQQICKKAEELNLY